MLGIGKAGGLLRVIIRRSIKNNLVTPLQLGLVQGFVGRADRSGRVDVVGGRDGSVADTDCDCCRS